MKTNSPRNLVHPEEFNSDGIPFKLLNEVCEDSRTYKQLAIVAIMANLLGFAIIAIYAL